MSSRDHLTKVLELSQITRQEPSRQMNGHWLQKCLCSWCGRGPKPHCHVCNSATLYPIWGGGIPKVVYLTVLRDPYNL